jgi:vanillate O-demethylase monooxygenase subunit
LGARYQLLNENILDLTHLTYTHEATIGTEAVVESALTFEDRPTHIHSVRTVRNDRATPFHARALGISGRVDRELLSDFYPPNLHASGSRFWSAEPGPDGERRLYGEFRVLHVATPETPHSTHYFWAFTRTFAKGDDEVTRLMIENFEKAIAEDIDAIEAQERVVDLDPPMSDASGLADAAAIRGRRRVEALIEKERQQAAVRGAERPAAVAATPGTTMTGANSR